MGIASSCRPTANRAPVCATGIQKTKAGQNWNSGRPLFPKSHLPVFALFSPCYLLLEKLSNSLIPLRDLPFRAQLPPCFSWKISLFPGKNRKTEPIFRLAMPDGLLGILGHQALEFGLGLLVFGMGRASTGKDCSKPRADVGRTHVDDAHRFDARLRRLGLNKRGGSLSAQRQNFRSAVTMRCW